jgi:hypothetical protein
LLRLAGRIEPMRRLMEAGAYRGAEMVIGYHTVRGDLAELRSLTEAGHEGAARELAWVARNLGEAGVLRELAATGDSWATYLLATVLGDRGELEEMRAYASHPDVGKLLVTLLVERGEVDEAIEVARALPRGHESLPALLARWEAVDELRAEDTPRAHVELAMRAVRRGDLAELLAYDWPDHWEPCGAFVKLLVELGLEDELRRRVAQDFPGTRTGLHDLLINQGREEELLGDPDAEETLARRMVNERRFADLLAWAERGSTVAGQQLWRHLDPGDPDDEERPTGTSRYRTDRSRWLLGSPTRRTPGTSPPCSARRNSPN